MRNLTNSEEQVYLQQLTYIERLANDILAPPEGYLASRDASITTERMLRQIAGIEQMEVQYWMVSLTRPLLWTGGQDTVQGLRWLEEVETALRKGKRPARREEISNQGYGTLAQFVALQAIHFLRNDARIVDPEVRRQHAFTAIHIMFRALAQDWWYRAIGLGNADRNEGLFDLGAHSLNWYRRKFTTSDEYILTYRGAWLILCQRLRMTDPCGETPEPSPIQEKWEQQLRSEAPPPLPEGLPELLPRPPGVVSQEPHRARWHAQIAALEAEIEAHEGPPPEPTDTFIRVLSRVGRAELLQMGHWMVSLLRPLLFSGGEATASGLTWLAEAEAAAQRDVPREAAPREAAPQETAALPRTDGLAVPEGAALHAAFALYQAARVAEASARVHHIIASLNQTCLAWASDWHRRAAGLQSADPYATEAWQRTYPACWRILGLRLRMLDPADGDRKPVQRPW